MHINAHAKYPATDDDIHPRITQRRLMAYLPYNLVTLGPRQLQYLHSIQASTAVLAPRQRNNGRRPKIHLAHPLRASSEWRGLSALDRAM